MRPCPASLPESGEEAGHNEAEREEWGEERAGASGELSDGMLPLETELEDTRLEPGLDRQYLGSRKQIVSRNHNTKLLYNV